MSSSICKWMVIYEDYSTQVITASDVMNVIMSSDLEQSDSDIISIIRLDWC